ncbi:hypothetical protein [Saccharothrix sp. NRRL B-16348]|uniref:hypothetical protein n=1 Tax=Saccharothrix sp. NRRL B-16348 TaxID=1415542 RepID=UPI000AA21BBE|nr:hypothetical protein [Saccharothrix sp. NRRL B-16348]
MNRFGLSALLAVTLTAVLAAPATADTGQVPCPARLPAGATCYGGQDANGAFYAFAIPADWNGSLVVHAHGGPDLAAPTADRPAEDLDRWAVAVHEGYALAGSSYRRGGYGTRMGAADTEHARELFARRFGEPRKTFLHGQSWGGNVAAKTIEAYDSFDAALLTNGVLAGGSRGYDYRVDLRVVYQYYCRNHPRPDEPQYPLWMGLRADSTLTGAGLRARLQECTGYQSPPAERSAPQQRNLDDILAVTRIPESTLASHLTFATFTFRDIVHHRLGGRNPFGNRGVRYTGSHDDAALNAGVERFSPTPSAARDLSYDSDPTGAVSIPVVTVHAIGDPTAFVEHESAYRASRVGAGTAEHLVQAFTTETEHSALSDAEYAAALRALVTWESTGRKPTPASIAADCPAADAKYGTGCFFDPAYQPAPYSAHVYPRPGGTRWPAMTAQQERLWERLGRVGIAH